ncbi:hypothetical protein HDE_04904 [Halotydeus destructor]|nr:hypothetical protein HDE_04904 [Halotydeus destructor]
MYRLSACLFAVFTLTSGQRSANSVPNDVTGDDPFDMKSIVGLITDLMTFLASSTDIKQISQFIATLIEKPSLSLIVDAIGNYFPLHKFADILIDMWFRLVAMYFNFSNSVATGILPEADLTNDNDHQDTISQLSDIFGYQPDVAEDAKDKETCKQDGDKCKEDSECCHWLTCEFENKNHDHGQCRNSKTEL